MRAPAPRSHLRSTPNRLASARPFLMSRLAIADSTPFSASTMAGMTRSGRSSRSTKHPNGTCFPPRLTGEAIHHDAKRKAAATYQGMTVISGQCRLRAPPFPHGSRDCRGCDWASRETKRCRRGRRARTASRLPSHADRVGFRREIPDRLLRARNCGQVARTSRDTTGARGPGSGSPRGSACRRKLPHLRR